MVSAEKSKQFSVDSSPNFNKICSWKSKNSVYRSTKKGLSVFVQGLFRLLLVCCKAYQIYEEQYKSSGKEMGKLEEYKSSR